jgi:Beta-galactosidase/beta-glucuronidase
MLLNDHWKLKGFDGQPEIAAVLADDGGWMDAAVPGDVHSTLLRYGKIEDPFYGTNVEKCRWVEGKTWWYRNTFRFDPKDYAGKHMELTFHGLDTLAEVYLNGESLGGHANMFIPAVFDVTARLRSGENRLDVRFDPVIAKTDEIAEKNPMYDRMWYSYNRNRAWVRKSQMNTRWDWGPRIVTAGIWQDVELNAYGDVKIGDVFLRTEEADEQNAVVCAEVNFAQFGGERELKAQLILSDEHQTVSAEAAIASGSASIRLEVPHPALWWTNGLGEAHLYDAVLRIRDGEKTADEYSTKFGIRTLRVKQSDERGNSRFLFVLNGVEVFAKGANWIPAHSLLGTVNAKTYRNWVTLAKESHMNMLRVWGGGIYEKKPFYEECDRQGILVWQDFMFACSSYPDFDQAFMENVRSEIDYTVKALRNHACLAIWCGNNEIQWIHTQKLCDLEDKTLYGAKIYHELMPELLGRLDPSRLYWPSSPFGGEDPNSDEAGDKHNWQVWAGQVYPHKPGEPMLQNNTPAGISFRNFTTDYCRFASEFGMHASPVMETLRSCIPQEELYYGSFQLRYRNRDKRPDRGTMLMEEYTGQPADLEQYVDYSMLAQAEGLKFGLEHYRRRMPECAGALIWQLNDCWPAMSWSIVDFYLRPKAGYYYTKRAFQPVLLSFREDSADTVSLWAANDGRTPYADRLEIGLVDFLGNHEYRKQIEVAVPACTSVKVCELSKNLMNVNYTNFEVLYVKPGAEDVGGNLLFFQDYRALNLPPCTLEAKTRLLGDGRLEVTVRSDVMAKFVKIVCPVDGITLSDNYFDLLPGQEKTVVLQGAVRECADEITAVALNSKKV